MTSVDVEKHIITDSRCGSLLLVFFVDIHDFPRELVGECQEGIHIGVPPELMQKQFGLFALHEHLNPDVIMHE